MKSIKTIVFDWGDTVMRVFPDYQGPMEAIPGIEAVLRTLHPRYRLALATNAAESGPRLVRAALRWAGLEEYFETVLTARELGARKPDPAFFRAILHETGCAPHEAVMVGDAYQADIVGAKQAGLRALWFNPTASFCPLVHPLHDAEVETMAGLPTAMEGIYDLPDVAECTVLLAEQEAHPRVVRHSETVAAVAFWLAARFKAVGEAVNPLLAHRGGLLHDLDKTTRRRLNRPHGQLGAQVLREKGYPELALIAERHVVSTLLDPARRPATWEEKLVYYADKIVEEDEVVSVQERLEALHQRYPQYADSFQRCQPLVLELEADICRRLGVSPAELGQQVLGKVSRSISWARSLGQ